jgi:hypothetical protein
VSTSLAFLLAAVVLSVVGCGLFLLRHRKPTSIDSGIDRFRRELRALAPEASTAIAARPAPPSGPDLHGPPAPGGPTPTGDGPTAGGGPAAGDERGR